MLVRRRTTWRSVVFNLLLFTFALCSSSAETKKPSCAACLSTGRAIERALSKNTGGEDSHQQQQQMQRRRGRSFPAFASEPAVAAALAAATCEEVRFFSSRLSLSRFLFCCFIEKKTGFYKERGKHSTKTQVPRRHRQSCLSLLAAHSAALADFFLNAPSSFSSPSHQRQQQLPSCTEELCVRLSGACRPHEVSGEL